jgi:hypothetical protein
MGANSIVWIVGAGFSASLGGPLFQDLFSSASRLNNKARFPPEILKSIVGDDADWVFALYAYGLGPDRSASHKIAFNQPGERLWGNAEEFLEFLDLAAQSSESPGHARLEVIDSLMEKPFSWGTRGGALAHMAKRLYAAECSGFLVGQSTKLERWDPYVRWLNEVVTADDTIISFNADGVIERILSEQSVINHVDVVLPLERDLAKAHEAKVALVLKLHGSVDWEFANGKVRAADVHYGVTASETTMVLGTPGPAKLKLTHLLDPLWKTAEDRLRKALAVVFLGYRFPATDASARKRLLEAIGRSDQGAVARIVLGADLRAANRLKALVDYAGASWRHPEAPRNPTGHIEPLYVEDFLAVCSRHRIFSER